MPRAGVIGDEAGWEAVRIEAGIPRFLVDMDTTTIPLEAGIEDRAISLTKGCYVGQEIIIRVLHRGHGRVATRRVGERLSDAWARAGAEVLRERRRRPGRSSGAEPRPGERSSGER